MGGGEDRELGACKNSVGIVTWIFPIPIRGGRFIVEVWIVGPQLRRGSFPYRNSKCILLGEHPPIQALLFWQFSCRWVFQVSLGSVVHALRLVLQFRSSCEARMKHEYVSRQDAPSICKTKDAHG